MPVARNHLFPFPMIADCNRFLCLLRADLSNHGAHSMPKNFVPRLLSAREQNVIRFYIHRLNH